MSSAAADDPLTCAEFVELVTDYLEGALDRWTEGRFVLHATRCPGCEDYLDQFRETIRIAGRLLAEFRTWKSGPQEHP